MDFEILDLIDDASAEANAFENHPTAELGMEEQVLYLKGLALIMSVDKDIDASEKEFIRILIKSMTLDESLLEDVVAFAQSPDKDTVQAFFKAFRHQANAQVFVFDALTMAFRDDELKTVEKAAIDKIANQLGVLKGVQQDIYDLFCHIKHNNWKESALYFNSHLLKVSQFQHLLSYYGVDYDQLMAETKKLRQSRLLDLISAKQAIGSKKVDLNAGNALSHDVVIPMLQAELDRGLAHEVDGKLSIDAHTLSPANDDFVDSEQQEVPAIEQFDLTANGIGFDQASGQLSSQEAKMVEDDQVGEYLRDKFFLGVGAQTAGLIEGIPTIIGKTYEQGYSYVTYHLSTPITKEIPLVIWEGHLFAYDTEGQGSDYHAYDSTDIYIDSDVDYEDSSCSEKDVELNYDSSDGDCRGRLIPFRDNKKINSLSQLFQRAKAGRLPKGMS